MEKCTPLAVLGPLSHPVNILLFFCLASLCSLILCLHPPAPLSSLLEITAVLLEGEVCLLGAQNCGAA